MPETNANSDLDRETGGTRLVSAVDWSGHLALLTDAARAAAEAITPFWRQNPEVWLKGGKSPVSEADFAADTVLKEFLLSAEPDFNWISEESEAELRDHNAPAFIVDPIDGTRGFLAGKTDWCVSIATTLNGYPMAGVLYQPLEDRLYACVRGQGATLNGDTIQVVTHSDLKGATIGATKSAARPLLTPDNELKLAPYCASLALRLAAVATGEIDVAIAGADAADWDLAAADLLVQEAGGVCVDEAGKQPCYEQVPFRHPRLIASNPKLVQQLRAAFGACPVG